MSETKKKLVRAPSDFQWIESFADIEKLGEIHAKLEAIAASFSTYRSNPPKLEQASAVYGYWYILEEICRDIAAVIKLDYWTGETMTNTEHTAQPRQ
jgi:hypothetical protein